MTVNNICCKSACLRCYCLIFFGLLPLFSLLVVKAEPYDDEWPNTDFSQSLVNLDEIHSGGPPKDGISAINKPKFLTHAEIDGWLDYREPVISVKFGRIARAYPLQVMIYHEIVNDELDGVPISITFCPLCNAAIAFDRRVVGKVLDFGTTGRLRKSNMIMYDRQTESWWQQFTGRAIVGKLVGQVLKQYPANIISYEDFLLAYPQGQILSKDTGYSRPYGTNPYRDYDTIEDQPFLLNQPKDERIAPMMRVISIQDNEEHRLYPFSLLDQLPVIEDKVGHLPIVIFSKKGMYSALDASEIIGSRHVHSATAWSRKVNGRDLHFEYEDGRILDTNTGSEWNLAGQAVTGPLKGKQLKAISGGAHFAFVWLAFNPKVEIYSPK